MSVSRVEYDAALKRVREAVAPRRLSLIACEAITLAALGLDEPPTEEEGAARYWYDDMVVPPAEPPKATGDDLSRFADWIERDRRESDKLLCHVASMRRRAFDLREPPKACPTCGGKGTVWVRYQDAGEVIERGKPCPACGPASTEEQHHER